MMGSSFYSGSSVFGLHFIDTLGNDECSTTQGPILWPLLNVVTGRQMFHWNRWMKCCPGTSLKAINECCNLDADVPCPSMNEVLPSDQSYDYYWMLLPGCRCSMDIDEWSANPETSPMAFTECCDLNAECSMGIDEWSAIQGLVLRPLWNAVTSIQMSHGHRWMKCSRGTSPTAITECCDWETDVPWASMNEVLSRD
jgi:hypothetical protein